MPNDSNFAFSAIFPEAEKFFCPGIHEFLKAAVYA